MYSGDPQGPPHDAEKQTADYPGDDARCRLPGQHPVDDAADDAADGNQQHHADGLPQRAGVGLNFLVSVGVEKRRAHHSANHDCTSPAYLGFVPDR